MPCERVGEVFLPNSGGRRTFVTKDGETHTQCIVTHWDTKGSLLGYKPHFSFCNSYKPKKAILPPKKVVVVEGTSTELTRHEFDAEVLSRYINDVAKAKIYKEMEEYTVEGITMGKRYIDGVIYRAEQHEKQKQMSLF